MEVRDAYVSPAGRAWMLNGVPAEPLSDLVVRIQKVRVLGELYGKDKDEPIKKLEGFDDLWESRVRHGNERYRQFFKFASIGGRRAVVFDDGTSKKTRRLPPRVLERADRRLDGYIDELQTHPHARERDLVK